MYSAIPEVPRPPMQHSAVSSILGANGQPLQEIAMVMVDFQLHTLRLTAVVIVTDIADEYCWVLTYLKIQQACLLISCSAKESFNWEV